MVLRVHVGRLLFLVETNAMHACTGLVRSGPASTDLAWPPCPRPAGAHTPTFGPRDNSKSQTLGDESCSATLNTVSDHAAAGSSKDRGKAKAAHGTKATPPATTKDSYSRKREGERSVPASRDSGRARSRRRPPFLFSPAAAPPTRYAHRTACVPRRLIHPNLGPDTRKRAPHGLLVLISRFSGTSYARTVADVDPHPHRGEHPDPHP